MRISGEGGRVRVGYQVAAWLGSWTLEPVEGRTQTYTLVARLMSVDSYWSQQAPMQLQLVVSQRLWTWSHVSPMFEAESQSLTVTLAGAPLIH